MYKMNVEKLIIEIQKYKELYDEQSLYYSNQLRRDEIWRDIGEAVAESAGECKAKWRELKDDYRKAMKLRQTNSGQAARTRPFRCGTGLPKTNLVVESDAEIQEDNLDVPDTLSQSYTEKSNLSQSLSISPSLPLSSLSPDVSLHLTLHPSAENKENSPNSPFQEYPICKKERQLLQQQQKDDPIDTDTFFRSLSQRVKSFPKKLQLEVKQDLFRVVTSAEASLTDYDPFDPYPCIYRPVT